MLRRALRPSGLAAQSSPHLRHAHPAHAANLSYGSCNMKQLWRPLKRLWKAAMLAATTIMLGGCALISGRTGHPSPAIPCNPSKTAYILDAVGTGYFALNTGLILWGSHSLLSEAGLDPYNRGAPAAVSGAITAAVGYSALAGSRYHKHCLTQIESQFRRQTRAISDEYWDELGLAHPSSPEVGDKVSS